ncbi:MAG: HEAT repeat domain-containing protein [Spirulina sp. DLM2.Bin59]|nr:MAG: HEAT repeat domain-containing protein [Spirulina sp. DLM2.Bin59]
MVMTQRLTVAVQSAEIGDWQRVCACLRQWLTPQSPPSPQEQKQAIALALMVLTWGDFQERWEVAKLLPQLGEGVVSPLIAMVEDEDCEPEARWFAGRILGEFPEPGVIEVLIRLLQTSSDEELQRIVAGALTQIGTGAIASLAAALRMPSSRPVAARSLAQICHPAVIDPLTTLIHDSDPTVRHLAIEALASFQDPRVLPILQGALRDPAAAVRREALIGLGLRIHQMEEAAFVGMVAPCLEDWQLEVCQQAALTLGRLGSPGAVAAIARVLTRPTTPIPLQKTLIRALGWQASEHSLKVLGGVLADLPLLLKIEVLAVLGRIEVENLRYSAARILVDYYQAYRDRALDPRIKQGLTQAWGQLGDPVAIDPLVQLMGDVDVKVRLHAIAALKRFDLPRSEG